MTIRSPESPRRTRSNSARAITLAALSAAALAIVCLLAFRLVRDRQNTDRGIVWGLPPRIPLAGVYPWGVNFAPARYANDSALDETLDEALATASRAGLRWVRITFPWAEIEPTRAGYRWEQADHWIAALRRSGLQLIAVLDTSPAWARASEDADEPSAPPLHYEDFGHFAAAFSARYSNTVAAYQVWDEPNIAPHWGNQFVDPVAYAFLLRTAAREIRAADSQAVIVAAALAPTTEPGGLNMNEVLFLRGMYGVGAARDFDVLAAEPYGFRTGPDDRRVHADLLSFSRVLLLREEMVDWGDREKPIWATAFGWNALPPDWAGRPSLWGTTTPEVQADYTVQAVERAQAEWPWMGVMLLPAFQPDAPLDDPHWGFALLGPDESPTPLYEQLVERAKSPWFAGPGWYPVDSTPRTTPVSLTHPALSFQGARLDLIVQAPLHLQAAIDGKPHGRELVAPLRGRQRLTLARGLPDGPHRAEVMIAQAGAASNILALVVSRERASGGYYLRLLGLLVAGAIMTWRLALSLRSLEPPLAWRGTLASLNRQSDWAYVLVMAMAVAGFFGAPGWPLILIAALVTGILYAQRPAAGLVATSFAIPFFLLPKVMPNGMQFSLVEILTMVGAAAWVVRKVSSPLWWDVPDPVTAQNNSAPADHWRQALDLAVLASVLLGLLSLTWATNFGTAARQFRVVVLEPAMLYALIRVFTRKRRDAMRLIDALLAAGLALSLHALWQAATGTGLITAEGVMRVRSVYGSPNNLALFLGRVLPISLALVAFGPPSRRRYAYGLATIPIAAALFLTFSRGAWLVGVPAAVVLLAWQGSRRLRATFTALILLGLAALVPFAGTERLTSLLNLRAGTTSLRINLWASTWQMIREHPWGGVGLDNFLYLYPRYIRPAAWGEPTLSHPHNLLLHFLVALGVLGLAIFLCQQTLFWRRVWPRLRRSSGWDRALLLALAASMTDFLAHGLIDHSYFLVDLAFVYMLTLGLVTNLSSGGNQTG